MNSYFSVVVSVSCCSSISVGIIFTLYDCCIGDYLKFPKRFGLWLEKLGKSEKLVCCWLFVVFGKSCVCCCVFGFVFVWFVVGFLEIILKAQVVFLGCEDVL